MLNFRKDRAVQKWMAVKLWAYLSSWSTIKTMIDSVAETEWDRYMQMTESEELWVEKGDVTSAVTVNMDMELIAMEEVHGA